MVGLWRHFHQRTQCALRRHNQFSFALETDAGHEIGRSAGLEMLHEFKEAILTLTPHDVVDVGSLKSLLRKQGWMPSPQHDGKLGIPGLDCPGNLHSFA